MTAFIFMIESFTTSNFYLAAFLNASGFEMARIEKLVIDGKSTFVFYESPELQKMAAAFLMENKVSVDVHRFIEKIKRLKSALYDG